jgi:hypothetical protein
MNKLIKKISKTRSSDEVIQDMKYAYSLLLQQHRNNDQNRLLSITITHTIAKHEKDLRHILTNGLFNTIHKEYKNTIEYINYLFVIEYSKVISQGKHLVNNISIHTHMVVNTTLPTKTIEYYINNSTKGDVYIEDISKREDKEQYINYITKQGRNKLLTDDHYNYKINMISNS